MNAHHLLQSLSRDGLRGVHTIIEDAWNTCMKRGLNINIERGIPSPAQLNLSQALLAQPLGESYTDEADIDCRNYGAQQGLTAARELFAPLIDVPADHIIVNGNSSLAMMYDCVSWALRHGVPGGVKPWSEDPQATFICVVPGYDRHFNICEEFGLRLIAVPMLENGPDMQAVREACRNNPSVKGMWCVPKYSNPTGTVYADSVVRELAEMKAAPDFRIFWDNAYCVHPLAGHDRQLADIYGACQQAGNPDRALIFASTSKMTLPGAGIAAMGASEANLKWWLKHASVRSVGPDKVSQLRQVRFLKDTKTVRALMEEHRQLLKPKFDLVSTVFEQVLGTQDYVRWTRPEGGYFISLYTLPGTASRIVELSAQAGVRFSRPGSCYPGHYDAQDAQLRIAPSFPDVNELKLALTVIAVSIALATVEKLSVTTDAHIQLLK